MCVGDTSRSGRACFHCSTMRSISSVAITAILPCTYLPSKRLDSKIVRMYLPSKIHRRPRMLRIPFLPHTPERLPLLSDAHPGSYPAEHLELGLQTVPVAAIKGTMSASQ